MDTSLSPQTPDLRHILPRDAYLHLVDTLHVSLPPPPVDTPEHLTRRDNAAIALIGALVPANAAEAKLAAQHVATDAHASHCMRRSLDPALSPELATKAHAQSISLVRLSHSALRLLRDLQAARHKREANPAAADQAAWIEHCAIGLMSQALPGAPSVAPMEPPPPSPAPAAQPRHADEPQPDPVAEAEQYAIFYPDRARLIRRTGGVPADAKFGPPPDYIAHQLVNGRTPALLALDAPLPADTPA
jgi:hypothetical protein